MMPDFDCNLPCEHDWEIGIKAVAGTECTYHWKCKHCSKEIEVEG